MRQYENLKMTKSITVNYIYNLLWQILTLITPLITTPYVSRILGAEKIGIASYIGSIVSYFALFAALGTASYGQREISYVQDNRDKRTEVFWNTEFLCCITTTLCFFLYIFFAITRNENKNIYLISSLTVLDVCCNVTWLFTGMEEFGLVVLRNTVIKVATVVFIFIAIHDSSDLPLYVFGIAAGNILSSISLWPFVHRFVDGFHSVNFQPLKKLKSVFSLFIPTVAISVYTILDKTMIGLLTNNPSENGFYEQAMKLSKTVLAIVTSLGAVMVPRIGFYFEHSDIKLVKNYMYKSYRFVFFLGIPLCFGMIAISSNIVPWFYGPGFEKIIPLLRILSFLVLAIGITNVTGMQYLIPTKRHHVFTKTVVIGAIVNCVSNLFLIQFWGCIGAAIASVFAESLIAFAQLFIVRKELSFFEILRTAINYLIAGIALFIVTFSESIFFSSSLVHTVSIILSGIFIYFLSLFLLKDSFFRENFKKVFTRFSHGGKEK